MVRKHLIKFENINYLGTHLLPWRARFARILNVWLI